MATKRIRFAVAGIAVALTLAYANHFENGFHFDDFHTIVNNPAIRSLANLSRFVTDPSTMTVLPANRAWRPLVTASLAIDYRLAGGLQPAYFHASTFFWFVIQIGVMYFLFRRILLRVSSEDTANSAAL